MVFGLLHLLWHILAPPNNIIPQPKDIIQLQVHVPYCGDGCINHMFLLVKKINGPSEFWKEENHLHWIFCDWTFKFLTHNFWRRKHSRFDEFFFADESFHHNDHYGNFVFSLDSVSI
jgi:hypothetical protein